MIPRPHQALVDLAGRIGGRILPELTDPYAIADTGMVTMLLGMLAKELESGVARRLEDGQELATLFADANHAPGAEARAAFAASRPASLTLTDVNAWLDSGLELVIELQAWAEREDPTLLDAIWAWLARHTERHRFD
ncbi:MAG: hypothetical protein AB7I04_15535 [Pseudomonadales bacterium]